MFSIAQAPCGEGACSNIEPVVPVRRLPVRGSDDRCGQWLPPKGKRLLSDAVRIAANQLRFTENAATVVVVADGIDICHAAPALSLLN